MRNTLIPIWAMDRPSDAKQWMQDFNAVSSAMGGIWRQMTTNPSGGHSWPKLKPQ
jgi:hypothetical protein